MPRETQSAAAVRSPITKAQIQLIKIGQKELGLDDDEYRDILLGHFRVSSCTQLTKAQATKLIARLEQLGFQTKTGSAGGSPPFSKRENNTPPFSKGGPGGISSRRRTGSRQSIPRSGGKVIGLATPEELEKISMLCSLIEWKYRDGFGLWAKKRLNIERVRTSREAYLAIEGLKKMFSNQMTKKHGKAWWTYQFKDRRVIKFIEEHCPAEYRR